MASIFTGFSDYDANGILNTWLAGAASVAPDNWYVGLLLTLPSNSVGAGYAEPWLPAPVISGITSVTTGGFLSAGNRYYEVTEVNASGETTASAEVLYTVPSGTSTNVVTVSWTGSGTPGNTFNVYEDGTSGSEGLIASGISTTYYQDTGPDTPGTAPPTTNTTGYGYARVEVAANSTNFPTASGRVITNGTGITWPAPTGPWGVCIGYALFDGAQVDANFRACGALLQPFGPTVGAPPYFAPGTMAIPFY